MLIRSNPLQILNDLNSLFESSLQRSHASDDTKVESGSWIPSVDIKEESDKFFLTIDVPGVKPQDVEISMENNVLTIKGSREELHAEDKGSYHRVERLKGSFYRRFNLPDTADAETITANAKLGVLTIAIGKKKTQQARKIKIETTE